MRNTAEQCYELVRIDSVTRWKVKAVLRGGSGNLPRGFS